MENQFIRFFERNFNKITVPKYRCRLLFDIKRLLQREFLSIRVHKTLSSAICMVYNIYIRIKVRSVPSINHIHMDNFLGINNAADLKVSVVKVCSVEVWNNWWCKVDSSIIEPMSDKARFCIQNEMGSDSEQEIGFFSEENHWM